MDQDTLFDLADDLAKYIIDYAKRHGLEVTISTCCCGELELRYKATESGGYYGATVEVEPLTGGEE